MKIGDVLFYRGTSLISKVISFFTKSPYTHVALVIGEEKGQLMILEAQRFSKIKSRPLGASEVYEVYRIPDLTSHQQWRIEVLSSRYEGRPYDYLEMIGLILRSWLKADRTLIEAKNKVYCSEVIDYVFYASGVKRWLKLDVGDVYPHELIQVYNLRKVDTENSSSEEAQVVK